MNYVPTEAEVRAYLAAHNIAVYSIRVCPNLPVPSLTSAGVTVPLADVEAWSATQK